MPPSPSSIKLKLKPKQPSVAMMNQVNQLEQLPTQDPSAISIRSGSDLNISLSSKIKLDFIFSLQ